MPVYRILREIFDVNRWQSTLLGFLVLLGTAEGACQDLCVRGLCQTIVTPSGNSGVCECGLFYDGPTCGAVKLDSPVKEIGPTYVSLTWNKQQFAGNVPDLSDFVFLVYTRGSTNVRDEHFIRDPVGDLTNGVNVQLTGLTSGGLPYVACLIHNSTDLGNLTNNELTQLTHEDQQSCLSFRTGYDENDPFTMAALWVGVTMGVVMAIIFCVGTVRQCNRKGSVGRRIRDRLSSSIKTTFLDRYAESKQRVEQRQRNGENRNVDQHRTAVPHRTGVLARTDDYLGLNVPIPYGSRQNHFP